MRTVYWLLTLAAAVVITAFATLHVGSAKVAASEPAAATANPVGTVRDVMRGIVDPNATAIWDSVGTESNDKGLVEKSPKTDEEWTVVERHALTLAEAANLLMTPGRHLALPEEANYKSKPDAPELTPTQIEQKIAANPAEWIKHARDLQATATKALAAARAKNKDALLDVGEAIDNACESCHLVYWYPDDKSAK